MCARCKSPYWDRERQKILKTKYLDVEDIVSINKRVIKEIPVKKSDKHEVLNRSAIILTINSCKKQTGDVWDKSVVLLRGIIKKHPFASGNRRTAIVAMVTFLNKNKLETKIRNNQSLDKILQGVREDYYTLEEIKNWIKGGEINDFVRRGN